MFCYDFVTSDRGLFQIPMVNFATEVAGCMYVCLVFVELLTRRGGKIPLVLFCGKVPVLHASIVLFKNIFEHVIITYMMFLSFFPLPTTLNFYLVLLLKICLGLMEINVINLRSV